MLKGKDMSLTNLQITTSTNSNGQLLLDIPTNLKNKKVDVKIEIHQIHNENKKNQLYDFSGLVGKLKWKGNAVKVQRELRDEWE